MNSLISGLHPFRLLLASLTMLAMWLPAAHAQDTYAERATIVTKLNAKLALLRVPASTTPLVLNIADIGTLNLRGVFGACVTVTDDPIITLSRNTVTSGPVTATMRIQTGPAGTTMEIPPNSHVMVCDLENAWLKRSWGLTFDDVIGDYVIGSGSPCLSGSDFQQPYFMDVLSNIWGGSVSNRTRDTLWNHVAEWSIQHKPYLLDLDATLTKVSATGLAVFPRVDEILFPGEDNFPFIVKREDATPRDIGYAKLAYAKVIFDKDHLANEDNVVKSVEIESRIHQYPIPNCGVQSSPGIRAPDPDSAYVRITFWVRLHPSDLDSTPHYIWRKYATSDPAKDNDDLWAFFAPDFQWVLDGWCQFNIDTEGYLYFEAKSGSDHTCTAPGTYRIMRLRFPNVPPTYCDYTFNLANEFALDAMTGTIFTRPIGSTDEAEYETVPCLDFCKTLSGYRTMSHVIAASAERFGNSWPYNADEFLQARTLNTWPNPNITNNIYETGQGRWRPMEAYAFRTGTKPGGKLSSTADRVYNDAGVFVNDDGTASNAFRLFDWRNPDANTGTKWLLASTATLLSPFGEPLEERDILGIYSTARFSHQNTMPRLVAKNARYTSVGYESFEDGKGDVNTVAHSGQWCLSLPHGGSTDKEVMKLTVTDQMRAQNVLVRLWVKRAYTDYHDNDLPVKITGAMATGTMKKIAQTGEWTLFEQVCDVSAASTGDVISLTVNNVLGSDDVWLDDVRAQPFDAEMVCYAYDPATLRLVAQFDDQHFGAFYQYNGEGKLVRTLRETERGIKTVAETQYHTPDMTNYDGTPASRSQLGGGAALGMAALRNPGGAGESQEANGDGGRRKMGGDFDLFDMKLGPDGLNWSLLGGRKPDLSSINPDSLRAMIAIDTTALSTAQLDRLHAAGLGDVEKLKDLVEVQELERRIAVLSGQRMDSLSTDERAKAESALADLQERRRVLMKERLGVDEEGLRGMYKSLKDAESESGDGKETER